MLQPEKKYWPWQSEQICKVELEPIPVLSKKKQKRLRSEKIKSAKRKIISLAETEIRLSALSEPVLTEILRLIIKPRLIRLYLQDEMICQLCFKFVHPKHVSQDHIIPKRYHGSDMIENMRLAHQSCNARCCSFERKETGLCPHEQYKPIKADEIQFNSSTTNRTFTWNQDAA